jgi:hypothetical protein
MGNKKYFLMLKQHNNTKLKYLCFHHGTESSCYTYKGSGKYWTSHLVKHGKDIITTILLTSDNQKDIATVGIMYSKMWNVVDSSDFANLTVEDAQTTAEPLHRPEVRQKRDQSLKDRIRTQGLTPKEKIARKKGVTACQQPAARKKAVDTIKNRLENIGKTDKEMLRPINNSRRIKTEGFTEKELTSHKLTSERQLGKTVKERVGDPNYVDPRKGKSAKAIYGSEYNGPWNKGRSIVEIKGDKYIDPRSEPFIITSHLGECRYKSTTDFIKLTHFSDTQLLKLKRKGYYTVKRQSNTRHPYLHGETIYFKDCNEKQM